MIGRRGQILIVSSFAILLFFAFAKNMISAITSPYQIDNSKHKSDQRLSECLDYLRPVVKKNDVIVSVDYDTVVPIVTVPAYSDNLTTAGIRHIAYPFIVKILLRDGREALCYFTPQGILFKDTYRDSQ